MNLNLVKVLIPENNKVLTIDNLLSFGRCTEPFSLDVVDFLNQISVKLLSIPSARQYPEIISLGFWLRRSNIRKMENRFYSTNMIKRPRGLVFHVAPSNVDTIFVYSLAISLLVGNRNVVRVSSVISKQMEIIISAINEVVRRRGNLSLEENLLVLSYPHDDEVNSLLSSLCEARVLWGGDDTVNYFTKIPIRPMATDLKFANKYSIAVLSASSICDLGEVELSALSVKFLTDSFMFAQQACSSARSVVFVDENATNRNLGSLRFWAAVKSNLDVVRFELDLPDITDKIVYTMMSAAQGRTHLNVATKGGELVVIDVKLQDVIDLEGHSGNGTFLSSKVAELEEINPYLTRSIQTISYFGFSGDELKSWLTNNLILVDRVVPIGSALEFNHIWDGVNIFDTLSRLIQLEI